MIEQILEKLDRRAISMPDAIAQLTKYFLSQGYTPASAMYKAEKTILEG